jgi:hypothetical protein
MMHVPPSDTITGSGRIVSQERSVESFRGIRIDGFGKVYLTQGPSQTLKVDADDNVIEQVTTSVVGGVLLLDVEKKTSYANVTIEVFVTVPDLEMLEIRGAGEFGTESPIQVETLVCNLAGAGTIRLRGSADSLEVRIGGSGDIRCFDLAART